MRFGQFCLWVEQMGKIPQKPFCCIALYLLQFGERKLKKLDSGYGCFWVMRENLKWDFSLFPSFSLPLSDFGGERMHIGLRNRAKTGEVLMSNNETVGGSLVSGRRRGQIGRAHV